MELSRLLRRGLFVLAIAAGGWLLSAGTASADTPTDETQVQTQSDGLLGGLLDGLTGTLDGVTKGLTDISGSVVDTAGDILSPIVDPIVNMPTEPIVDVPSLLPTDLSSGSAATDQNDVSRSATVPVPEPVAPPVAPVAAPVTAPSIPEPTAPPVVPAPVVPATPDDGGAAEHAGQGGSLPHPAKAPAAPAGSGTTASNAHDNSGGARGTHGVLTSQTTLHPADAGFTTRSRAVNASGRVAGLPASSPD